MPMEDLKTLMKDNYLQYASYVIQDRAIPHIIDGLKPVQRRILHTLYSMHDGKMHKVANVAGQTMAFHPHGDAPINEAIVNLANKGYLLDRQGNFGNLYTGDPAAAPRYIEARLSPLAMETLFNPDLTETIPSYDGRKNEPTCLPAKIPLLLLQGAEGIAVGMATKILPHNFVELLEAEIAILEGKSYKLVPDFPTGGILDATEYAAGRGKVKLRAKIDIADPKTLVIKEICYGTTTESLIHSIDEAAKKGKIKIESINDFTAENVEIEIKLPRGVYAENVIDALYAYTECEISLNSQIVVIKDNLPYEADVHEILAYNVEKLQQFLKRELEIEAERLLEKVFQRTLEQIFIENRLYKKIENVASYEKIHDTIAESLKPYHKQLSRTPTYDDREKLLAIPIRRISRFDIDKNQEAIKECQARLEEIDKDIRRIKQFTIRYLRHILKKYGDEYPRKTVIGSIEEVDRRAIEERVVKVGVDFTEGYVGTSIASETAIECSNYDKLLVMNKDGTYSVINIPEKQYVQHEGGKIAYIGVADKKTVISVVYRDMKTKYAFAKRFVVSQFILEKEYRYVPEGTQVDFLTTQPEAVVNVQFVPKKRQKVDEVTFACTSVAVKGVAAKGIRIANKEVKKVSLQKRGDPYCGTLV